MVKKMWYTYIYNIYIYIIFIYIHMCAWYVFSQVRVFVTLWTVAHQASLSKEFSRQEYWSGLPCPPPGDLPDPGIKPMFPASQADSLLLSHLGSP